MFDQQEHAKVRSCLEHAVELEPDYSDAWAVLANIYAQEHRYGYNPRPELYDPHERSLTAAYRAVEIEPRNPTAQLMLANALFDRRNLAGFKAAGKKSGRSRLIRMTRTSLRTTESVWSGKGNGSVGLRW